MRELESNQRGPDYKTGEGPFLHPAIADRLRCFAQMVNPLRAEVRDLLLDLLAAHAGEI